MPSASIQLSAQDDVVISSAMGSGSVALHTLQLGSITGDLFITQESGWLESDALVDDLGAIGILYLMFLAGLSFDIKAFNDNRRMAITFGSLPGRSSRV